MSFHPYWKAILYPLALPSPEKFAVVDIYLDDISS